MTHILIPTTTPTVTATIALPAARLNASHTQAEIKMLSMCLKGESRAVPPARHCPRLPLQRRCRLPRPRERALQLRMNAGPQLGACTRSAIKLQCLCWRVEYQYKYGHLASCGGHHSKTLKGVMITQCQPTTFPLIFTHVSITRRAVRHRDS